MSKHIVVLETEEIKAMKTLCRAGIKMASDGSAFFIKVDEQAKSVLLKLLQEVPDENSRE